MNCRVCDSANFRWPNFKEWWDLQLFHLTRWSKKAIENIFGRKGYEIIDIRIGCLQGDDLINYLRDKTLKRGIVTSLLKEARFSANKEVQQNLLNLKKAKRMARLGSILYSAFSGPVGVGLSMLGGTGKTLYVLAKRD